MEPAVDRREHTLTRLTDVRVILAAMEPAVDRREHAFWRVLAVPGRGRPQWSPPLIGGNTAPGFGGR